MRLWISLLRDKLTGMSPARELELMLIGHRYGYACRHPYLMQDLVDSLAHDERAIGALSRIAWRDNPELASTITWPETASR